MTEAEETFQNILGKIALKYNFESQDKNVILKHIEVANPELSKLINEYSVLIESYLFIKTDKMLMLKARDVWMTELKLFSQSIKEIADRIESIIC
jgi:glycyl-tRNA synthetase alpha subunit